MIAFSTSHAIDPAKLRMSMCEECADNGTTKRGKIRSPNCVSSSQFHVSTPHSAKSPSPDRVSRSPKPIDASIRRTKRLDTARPFPDAPTCCNSRCSPRSEPRFSSSEGPPATSNTLPCNSTANLRSNSNRTCTPHFHGFEILEKPLLRCVSKTAQRAEVVIAFQHELLKAFDAKQRDQIVRIVDLAGHYA